jgi:hypothetical protein
MRGATSKNAGALLPVVVKAAGSSCLAWAIVYLPMGSGLARSRPDLSSREHSATFRPALARFKTCLNAPTTFVRVDRFALYRWQGAIFGRWVTSMSPSRVFDLFGRGSMHQRWRGVIFPIHSAAACTGNLRLCQTGEPWVVRW